MCDKTKLECKNCGGCCIPWLPITYQEYETIKEYIQKNNITKEDHRDGNNFYMDCPFHDRKNKRCKIYEVRPFVCQDFYCCRPKKERNRRRNQYDKRADINGKHLDKLFPLDLLFYDDPTTLFILINQKLKPKSEEELLQILIKTGHKDIVDAIKKGGIKLYYDE